MYLNQITSIPINRFITAANLGGFSEALFRKWGVRIFDEDSGILVNHWIDYPQSLAASMIAFSILGKGRSGSAALVSFAVLPIACKTISSLTVSKTSPSKLHRIANGTDHLIRLAAKITYFLAAVHPFYQGSLDHDGFFNYSTTIAGAFTSCFFLITDVAMTCIYAQSKFDDFYAFVYFQSH